MAKKAIYGILIAGVVMGACLVGMVLQRVTTAEVVPAATATAEVVVVSTNAVEPTATDMPEPTATATSVPEPTATNAPGMGNAEYLDELQGYMVTMQDGLERLADLGYNADFESAAWRRKLDDAADLITSSYLGLLAMDPPEEYEDVHGTVLWATVDCYDAMPFLMRGVDNLDPDEISESTELISSCGDKLRIAADKMALP